MIAFDSRPWIGGITAPTLVVCGSVDHAVPRRHAELLMRGVPLAELNTVLGAGHFLVWTHPEESVDAAEAWLAR